MITTPSFVKMHPVYTEVFSMIIAMINKPQSMSSRVGSEFNQMD